MKLERISAPGTKLHLYLSAMRRLSFVLLFFLTAGLYAGVADNPDVTGQERLFEGWIRAQIAYRGLPGIAVGVVSDQELVWAKGFGFCGPRSEDSDDAGDKIPYGFAQQTVHSYSDHAIARRRQNAAGRSGGEIS